MLKALLLCAALCAAPSTVSASDRDVPLVPDLKAFMIADGAVGVSVGGPNDIAAVKDALAASK